MYIMLLIRWHLDRFQTCIHKHNFVGFLSRAWKIDECLSILGAIIDKLAPLASTGGTFLKCFVEVA